jgi:alanyl-tRNA synthetase
MKVAQIRQKFLDYFQSKGHEIIASSSLIPSGDPTLLFTTAGMVQFKPYFTGAVDLKFTRAATSQKCLRTSDLENVGKTERHCTFFEMLGNFSFGDYFKEDAIHYALDFSLNHLNIEKEKIWITVYLDDEEAIRYWQAEGISKDKITRLGKEDNFWGPAGDSGACGPCSELYLDRGVSKGYEGCGTKASCKPGCNCDRFLEYWNLVFNQFDQDTSGVQHPLKQTGIDTGSGLERVALLLQNVDSVFDTDELQRIIQYIETLSGQKYTNANQAAFRVLTDHSRAICFAIADGVMPDKTGRGYVIRRLIRRASLFARKLQIKESFLYKIIPEIIQIYSISYPELKAKEKLIIQILKNEEELFLNTLELGLEVLEIKMKKLSAENSILMGKDSFQLYGTYGFPKEMTKEILEERGFGFDLKSFEEELEKDRTLSRDSWKGKKSSLLSSQMNFPITEFSGYENTIDSGKLLGILLDGVQQNSISENKECVFILNRSSFYGESGGQIGDSGFIKSKDSIFKVSDTWKENDIILHIGIVLKGKFEPGETLSTEVEFKKRENLTLHHSGTHLLNGALRKLLGEHVHQKASLVSDEYLRFDFSHPSQLKEDEILEIESNVNHAIDKSVLVNTTVLAIEEAKKTGAVAFFDEKYGDQVRVVSMDSYSTEFCGGTHVKNTSELSYFYILKESSPGAGNRRIEAVCGERVVERIQEEFQILQNKIESYHLKSKDFFQSSEHFIKLKSPAPIEIKNIFQEKKSAAVNYFRNLKKTIEQEIADKNDFLLKEKKRSEKKESEQLFGDIESIIENGIIQNKTKLFLHNFQNQKIENLKEIADRLKNREEKILICFFNENPENETILLMTNKNSLASGVDCKNIFQSIPKDLQVRGGGKSDMVQGSFEKSKKESIINSIKIELLKE